MLPEINETEENFGLASDKFIKAYVREVLFGNKAQPVVAREAVETINPDENMDTGVNADNNNDGNAEEDEEDKETPFSWNRHATDTIIPALKESLIIFENKTGKMPLKQLESTIKAYLRGAVGELVSGAIPVELGRTVYHAGPSLSLVMTDLSVMSFSATKAEIQKGDRRRMLMRIAKKNLVLQADKDLKSQEGAHIPTRNLADDVDYEEDYEEDYTTPQYANLRALFSFFEKNRVVLENTYARLLAHPDTYNEEVLYKLISVLKLKFDEPEAVSFKTMYDRTALPDGLLFRDERKVDEVDPITAEVTPLFKRADLSLSGFVEVKSYTPAEVHRLVDGLITAGSGATRISFEEDGKTITLGFDLAGSIEFLDWHSLLAHQTKAGLFSKKTTSILLRFPADADDSDLKLLGEYLSECGYESLEIQKLPFTSDEIDELGKEFIVQSLPYLESDAELPGGARFNRFNKKEVMILKAIAGQNS